MKVVHILLSDYSVDSRVKNETESLSRLYDVTVMCMKSKTINDIERNGVKISRNGFVVGSKFLGYFLAYVSIFIRLLTVKNIGVVHAHDMNTLVLGYAVSRVKRVPLIYDAHELWSQSHHGNHKAWVLNLAMWVERIAAKRADAVITVSDSIAKYLALHFENKNVSVVRNIPSYTHGGTYDIFREKYDIDDDETIFLYQGLITKFRGAKLIIDAVRSLPETYRYKFVFMGSGDYVPKLKELIQQHGLENRILLEGFVPQSELLKYTSSADVGVHALDRSCLNHEYCLPNKIFEYLHSGLALMFPDLLELNKFISEHEVGLVYDSGNVASLAESMMTIMNDPEGLLKMKEKSSCLKNDISWGAESKVLFDVYEDVLKRAV